MTENDLILLAKEVVNKLKEADTTLSVAESCTGGWLSKILTEISGVSQIYQGGVCSYSNDVKMKILGVREETLRLYGAVSSQTAEEMANGVRKALESDIGIGITGIAGPLSDNTQKPVGLIYVSVANGKETKTVELKNTFTDNVRLQNRLSAVETALHLLGGINEEKKAND